MVLKCEGGGGGGGGGGDVCTVSGFDVAEMTIMMKVAPCMGGQPGGQPNSSCACPVYEEANKLFESVLSDCDDEALKAKVTGKQSEIKMAMLFFKCEGGGGGGGDVCTES